MKLRTFVLLFLFVGLMAGCETDKQAPEPEESTFDRDGLPKPSSNGQNVFGFMLAGKAWWGDRSFNKTLVYGTIDPNLGNKLTLIFTIWDTDGTSFKYRLNFSIDGADLAAGKTYLLKAPASAPSYARVEERIKIDATNFGYRDDPTTDGKLSSLTITTIDKVKHLVSGNFELRTEYYEISKGRFDLDYTQY